MAMFNTHWVKLSDGSPLLRRKFFNWWFWPWRDWDFFRSRKNKVAIEMNGLIDKLEHLAEVMDELEAQEREIIHDIEDHRNEQRMGESRRRFMKMSLFARKPDVYNLPTDDRWVEYYRLYSSGRLFDKSISDVEISGLSVTPSSRWNASNGDVIATISQPLKPHNSNNNRKNRGNNNNNNQQ